MRHLLVLSVLLFILFDANSTHIVGGSLTYEHLGGSSYNIKLKLYRDCDGGLVDFPTQAYIEIRSGFGNDDGLSEYIDLQDIIELEPPIDSCAVDPGICVEEAIYSKIISLPPTSDGYHLFHQQYARNESIINLNDPGSTGEGFNTYIPSPFQWLSNSSPSWVNFPPVFVCQGQDVNFDHSATDSDGDSLVYSLYRPYDGRRYILDDDYATYLPTINPTTPNPPDNIDFPLVNYEVGFTENNPLNVSGTLLTIDAQTGLLSGIPEDIGQFVVGIKCEEYRNGEKIGIIVRDFQFNVINCPPAKDAAIGPVKGCAGTAVDMINASAPGATDFYWDFGDGNNVEAYEPSHNYAAVGDYQIMLIAQYNTVCADTAYYDLRMGGVTADINPLDSTCVNNSVNMSEGSTIFGNMVVDHWVWDFGDGSPVSNVPNPSHTYTNSGDFGVQLVVGTDAGCFDTVTEDVFIQSQPVADVGPDTTACFNDPTVGLNGVVTNATGGVWVGNGGSFNPNTSDLNANYLPTQSEVDNGSTFIVLSSTGNGFCPSDIDTLHVDFISSPIIDAGPDKEVCSDTSSVPLTATFQFSGGIEWYTIEGTGTFSNALTANTEYFPSIDDVDADSVKIYSQTTINGSCNPDVDSMWIFFYEPPTITLVYPDTICANNPVSLNANSTTGEGVWSTSGDGAFNPDTSNVASYIHGDADLTNGEVNVYFASTNNSGCQVQRDTVKITVLPSPDVDFNFSEECYGKETSLTGLVSSVDPVTDYSWSYNGTEFSTIENPDYIIPDIDTNNITFIAFSQNGCSDTITKSVFTFHLPDVSFNTPAPCSNGGTQYFDESQVKGSSAEIWEWSFGDGNTSDEQDPLYQYDSAGDYTVLLAVTSEDGCVDSVSNNITIFPGPEADFSTNPNNAYVFENINFADLTQSAFPLTFWNWNLGDGNFSEDQNPSHNYAEGGDYEVTLIVEDENGCLDTAKNIVNIYLPPIVPSGFSPNGDSNNDFLHVYGGPYETLEFKVYNNWGEVIFRTDDATKGWDGTFNGEIQPIGVYVWTVRATTIDGTEHDLSGDTSLIR